MLISKISYLISNIFKDNNLSISDSLSYTRVSLSDHLFWVIVLSYYHYKNFFRWASSINIYVGSVFPNPKSDKKWLTFEFHSVLVPISSLCPCHFYLDSKPVNWASIFPWAQEIARQSLIITAQTNIFVHTDRCPLPHSARKASSMRWIVSKWYEIIWVSKKWFKLKLILRMWGRKNK